MKEICQAKEFYDMLDRDDQEELWETLAENLFFLDDELQQKILELLERVDMRLCMEITKRNSFTTR